MIKVEKYIFCEEFDFEFIVINIFNQLSVIQDGEFNLFKIFVSASLYSDLIFEQLR